MSRQRRRPSRSRPSVGGQLDLHGLDRDSAAHQLNAFVEEAVALGESQLLVVHGKGSGVLGRAVRRVLSGHPHVEHHHEAPPEMGGAGARIVRLRLEEA